MGKRELDQRGRKKCALEEVTECIHKRLILFFMREYLVKGEAGMLVHSDLLDPVKADDKFEACACNEYAAKSDNYEDQFTKGR